MIILGIFGIVQILDVVNDYFGGSTTFCCGSLIVIGVVFFLVRRRGKEKEVGREDLPAEDPWMFLEDGKRLLSQGMCEEAVAAYLQAYREGSPTVRDQALKALEELGEVDTF
jgi:hypothetical protein